MVRSCCVRIVTLVLASSAGLGAAAAQPAAASGAARVYHSTKVTATRAGGSTGTPSVPTLVVPASAPPVNSNQPVITLISELVSAVAALAGVAVQVWAARRNPRRSAQAAHVRLARGIRARAARTDPRRAASRARTRPSRPPPGQS